MTRDETIRLFMECEAKRIEALAAGRSPNAAQEAATARWNAWAEALLSERKSMEADGSWTKEKDAWFSRAYVDFSFCLFLNKGVTSAKRETEAKAALSESAAKAGFNPCLVSSHARIKAEFPAGIRFIDFHFPGEAKFQAAIFAEKTWFDRSTFHGDAIFYDVIFQDIAHFMECKFVGKAKLNAATFSNDALFKKATFGAETWFTSTNFYGDVWFDEATFLEKTHFYKSYFNGDAIFYSVKFKGETDFKLATFLQFGNLEEAIFEKDAIFVAARGERAFTLTKAVFSEVPDFTQAHFAEPPRIDDMKVMGRSLSRYSSQLPKEVDGSKQIRAADGPRPLQWRVSALCSLPVRRAKNLHRQIRDAIPENSKLRQRPARWRALKRLAVQGHDTERELTMFLDEVRSARLAGDWPAPFPIWKATVWVGFFRFWLGLFYEFFSGFGRSVLRPFVSWVVGVALFAAVYLGQTPAVKKTSLDPWWTLTIQAGGEAISHSIPCYSPPANPIATAPGVIDRLDKELGESTNARAEALHLAFRNGLVALDGGSDASYRIYGCLYGRAGNTPVVPAAVSSASAIQKVFSGLMIFLFGLALRNMLKVK